MDKVIFKDEICDAKWDLQGLTCHKGRLNFTGNNVTDFKIYRAFCEGCSRKHIVDRGELKESFEQLATRLAEKFEEE